MDQLAQPVLGYIETMLKGLPAANEFDHLDTPHIYLLGLGCGSIGHAAQARMPQAYITAVDINQDLIDAAQRWFACPTDHAQWQYVCQDASIWLMQQLKQLTTSPAAAPQFVAMDVYDAQTHGPAIGLNGEYGHIAQLLHPKGCLAVNLHEQYALAAHLTALNHAFDGRVKVHFVQGQGNPIAFAYGAKAWQQSPPQTRL